VREQRRWKPSDSSLVAIIGLFGFFISVGGILYSAFGVSWQTTQNAAEISSMKTWIINHEKKDEDHGNIVENRLERIEEKLDKLIGQVDGERRH